VPGVIDGLGDRHKSCEDSYQWGVRNFPSEARMTSKSSYQLGRLNAFQRVMRHWSELHPYNATHTYKIAGPLRLAALEEALAETYIRNGLGIVEVSPDGLSYQYHTDPNPSVEVIPAGEDADRSLESHVSKELNHPFERPRCRPIRFGVIEIGPHAHYIVVAYDHWTADSVAARLIMQRVLGRYCGLEMPENERPLELYPGTYREVFSHRLGRARLGAAALKTLGQWLHDRGAARVGYALTNQMSINFQLHRTRPGTVTQLREFARPLDATVHDVILAALGRAMMEFLPSRVVRRGRDMLLGTIVDTRPDSREDLSDSLGTFLAYYPARVARQHSASLAELTTHIAGLTRPIKARRSYLNSLLNMRFVSSLWGHLNESARPHFMRNVLPMAAGVSNVCLRNTWMNGCGANHVLEYIRGASTGPALPLVLSPTTLGQQLNVGVTYRTAGFSTEKINGIMEMLLDQLEHPQQGRGGRGVFGRRPDRTVMPLRRTPEPAPAAA
jgi:hypothetical protein